MLDLVDDLVATHVRRGGDEDPESVDAARGVWAEHGLWTLGAAEAEGGGGADPATTMLALARLAGTWPALAWAGVQAHAAALVAADGTDPDLLAALHQGEPVAVVALPAAGADADAPAAEATSAIPATVERVDAAHRSPRLVLLTGGRSAVVVPAAAVGHGPTLGRTGLDGVMTHACTLDPDAAGSRLLDGPAVGHARAWLLIGAAAVAAGIAEAAAQTARDYSRQREQFGAPLIELPTVRASLADQATTVRRLLRSTLSADPDDLVGAAAALGPVLDDAFAVVSAAVQSLGGYGYMAEYVVEGMLRDLVSLRAVSQATEEGRWAATMLVGVP